MGHNTQWTWFRIAQLERRDGTDLKSGVDGGRGTRRICPEGKSSSALITPEGTERGVVDGYGRLGKKIKERESEILIL